MTPLEKDEVILNVFQVIAGIIGVALVAFSLVFVLTKISEAVETTKNSAYDFAIEKAAKISKDLEEAKK